MLFTFMSNAYANILTRADLTLLIVFDDNPDSNRDLKKFRDVLIVMHSGLVDLINETSFLKCDSYCLFVPSLLYASEKLMLACSIP